MSHSSRQCRSPVRTSGGVLVGGVTREALDEALEGDGLMDTLESLSASVDPFPFI